MLVKSASSCGCAVHVDLGLLVPKVFAPDLAQILAVFYYPGNRKWVIKGKAGYSSLQELRKYKTMGYRMIAEERPSGRCYTKQLMKSLNKKENER